MPVPGPLHRAPLPPRYRLSEFLARLGISRSTYLRAEREPSFPRDEIVHRHGRQRWFDDESERKFRA